VEVLHKSQEPANTGININLGYNLEMKIHAPNEKAQHAPKRVSYFAFAVREGGRPEGEITIGTP
jgi:hypothetical protein